MSLYTTNKSFETLYYLIWVKLYRVFKIMMNHILYCELLTAERMKTPHRFCLKSVPQNFPGSIVNQNLKLC